MDKNLVLTGVYYEEDNLRSQMENALRKFVGRNMFAGEPSGSTVEDSTYLTSENLEQVLISKGWTKPQKGDPKKRKPSENSSGKKNWIDKEGRVAKCFKCACAHEHDCNF